MKNGGLYLVVLILFIETGIIIGFFLPGDPLLFISGMVIASTNEVHYPFSESIYNLFFWISLFMTASILGNLFGYWFGKRFSHFVNRGTDSWLLKKKHVDSAKVFYDKRGGYAIVIARFLPIVRTFAPIIAGTVKMDYRKFVSFNIAGAVLWVVSLTTMGYALGNNSWVKQNLEFIILGIVLLVSVPVILKLVWKKKA